MRLLLFVIRSRAVTTGFGLLLGVAFFLLTERLLEGRGLALAELLSLLGIGVLGVLGLLAFFCEVWITVCTVALPFFPPKKKDIL